MKELELPIESVAKRLSFLEKAGQVCQAAKKEKKLLQLFIYEGFGKLVKRFNDLDPESPVMTIMPKTKNLKTVLAGQPLPSFEKLSPRDLAKGIKEAAPLMELGQRISKGEALADNAAIATPSMPTNDLALAVGTAGHLLERTIFAYMRRRQIAPKHQWQKDDVLFALHEAALLLHAETITKEDISLESPLYPIIASPNSLDFSGGLGWLTNKEVASFIDGYLELYPFEDES